ncbi:MAG: hypothetical protein AAGC53_15695, partial [Actinomycetota bacterium]
HHAGRRFNKLSVSFLGSAPPPTRSPRGMKSLNTDVNQTQGRPLHQQQPEVVAFLIEQGADPCLPQKADWYVERYPDLDVAEVAAAENDNPATAQALRAALDEHCSG